MTRPPETLAGLQALAAGGAVALGPKARAALEGVISLVGDPALLSITALARRLGVHASTLTRLAHSLGYPGFPALQRVLLQASMAPAEAFYSRQSQAALAGHASPRARAERLCRENQANIQQFIDRLDITTLETASRTIMGAPRVAVHGTRQFRAVSSFLAYGLRMIRPDVGVLDAEGSGVAEGLAALGPNGVLISTSCAPYSAQILDVAAAARAAGIATIALTDSPAAALAHGARATITVPHGSSFLSNSLGAFVVAVECLVNACAALRPEATAAALAERDRLIARMAIERA